LIRAPRVACALVLFALLALACDANQALFEQQAIEHLCWTEQRLRTVANPEKAAFLADMARSPCPKPDACRLRDKCTSAYTLHVDALNLTQAAKQQIADGQPASAAGLLGAAESNLKQAGVAVEECTTLAAEIRRRYGVNR
jgi:hypothetical protein